MIKLLSYIICIIIIAHSAVFLIKTLSNKTDKVDTVEDYKNHEKDLQTAEPINFIEPQIKEEIKLYY